jgi:hypothetical protein
LGKLDVAARLGVRAPGGVVCWSDRVPGDPNGLFVLVLGSNLKKLKKA